MASGELRVKGKIDLAQFWPTGTADADTTKIQVIVGANAFRFRPHPGAPVVLCRYALTDGNVRVARRPTRQRR